MRDWLITEYGLQSIADKQFSALRKTVTQYSKLPGTLLVQRGAPPTGADPNTKFDARLWIFGQMAGVSDLSPARNKAGEPSRGPAGTERDKIELALRELFSVRLFPVLRQCDGVGLTGGAQQDATVDCLALLFPDPQVIAETLGDGRKLSGEVDFTMASKVHLRRSLGLIRIGAILN